MIIRKKKNKTDYDRHLSKRIIVIIAFFILISSLTWGSFLVSNVKQNVIDSAILEEESYIERVQASVNTTTEVCSLATQIVTQSSNLMEYFKKVKNNEDLKTVEKKNFYDKEIAILEDLTNANPYLYQVRIYVDSEKITEKMPSIYRRSRLDNLPWAKEGYGDGQYKFDYDDSVFPAHTLEPQKHILSKVTPVYDDNQEELCVIEVASYLECLFPKIYEDDSDKWSFFIDKNGVKHGKISDSSQDMINKVARMCNDMDDKTFFKSVNGKDYIISTTKVDDLNGRYVHITSMEKSLSSFYSTVWIYAVDILISTIIFVVIGIFVVKNFMKRFYHVYDTIIEIGKGKDDITVPEEGNDEITKLAYQINVMLKNTKALHEDNLNKQVMAKNAEIKALQNQINAHFMYNALESIKMLAEIDGKFEISDAVTALGRMLRYSMHWVSGTVTIEEETEYLKNYISLINIGYDYEIFLSINVPEEMLGVKIPKMSLQPLVENAVYHGIEDIATDTTIYIKGVVLEDNQCKIEVSDCGKGMREEELDYLRKKLEKDSPCIQNNGHGIGLKNVSERMRLVYGNDFKIEVYSKQDCYTKIIIKIPMLLD